MKGSVAFVMPQEPRCLVIGDVQVFVPVLILIQRDDAQAVAAMTSDSRLVRDTSSVDLVDIETDAYVPGSVSD